MTLEEHKAAIRRVFEGHRKRNLDAIDELFAEDFVNHSPMIGCAPDRKGLKDSFLRSFEAFPDIQYTLNDQIAEGDKVVTHFTMTGTHNGPFLGIQPTGNTFEVSSITITRHEGNKLVERWNVTDALSLLQQLDLVSIKGMS